jgi:predicted nucleic acid-binding protein
VSLLVDTNVISELRKGPRADDNVVLWFEGVEEEDIHLSVLVVGELRRGIERLRGRDARQAGALEAWLRQVVRQHGERILPVDWRVAEQWGSLTAMRSGSVIDTLMAATALVFGSFKARQHATRRTSRTGVSCLNPFDPRAVSREAPAGGVDPPARGT